MQIPSDPPLRLLAAFQLQIPAQQPAYIVQAPGREMWVAAVDGQGGDYQLYVDDLDSTVVFNFRTARAKRTRANRPLPSWSRYPAGVVVTLAESGLHVPSIHAVIVSSESPGPRYDYALGVTIAALWYTVCDQPYSADDLIEVVEKVHRDYI